MEIVILLANDGLFREALEELDLSLLSLAERRLRLTLLSRYLPSLPYQDSSLLHTYAGMMSLKLARVPGKDLQASLDYFRRALALDSDNEAAKNYIEEVCNPYLCLGCEK